MRAMVLTQEHGFPQLQNVPDPVPGERELLLKVEAAGINYADTMMRRGFYIQKPAFPYVPGFEFSGTVVELGPGSLPSWQGARVMGLCQSAFAEYVTVAEAQAIPIPKTFSYEQAAAFPVVFLTAFAMLKISAKAVPGESILIHAAGGGVGTAAIQLAKKMGLGRHRNSLQRREVGTGEDPWRGLHRQLHEKRFRRTSLAIHSRSRCECRL
jgi:NADPH:quinone reductase